jgi:hypothetical protein
MAGVSEVTITDEEKIEFFSQTGVSESTIEAMANDPEEVNTLKEGTPFDYNGITYYGETTQKKFESVEEFNTAVNQENEYGADQGNISLTKEADGSYTLMIIVNSNTADTSEIEANMEINGISKNTIKRLMNDMVMRYTFNMPGKVTQVSGGPNGVTINGNKVTIDYLKLDIPKNENEKIVYKFSTKKEEKVLLRFNDVPETLWSYKAIETLAKGGLVSGIGDGMFAPERGMKITEFCQVLVNANGLESGPDESGYWAAKAVKSCIDAGYILGRGEIIPENYDKVITREEAIAAMQIASGREPLEGSNITLEDIPDGDQIDEKYRDLVLQAYNSGITTGVNDQYKFSPKNQLTRAQVCQLFYNVNWTTKK